MCILKIHANSHTANAIQSVAHNMDTIMGDLDTLKRLLVKRERKSEVETINLCMFHLERERRRVWAAWSEFVSEASPDNDSVPIGAESVEHPDGEASYFRYDGHLNYRDGQEPW